MARKEKTNLSLSEVYAREKKRRLGILLIVSGVFAYCFLVAGAWVVIRSPLFKIQKIEISGNQRVSSEDITTVLYARVFDNSFWRKALGFKNILIWPSGLSPNDLKLLPEVKSVSFGKSYRLRTVLVTVVERQPSGIWCLRRERAGAEVDNAATASTSSVEFQSVSSADSFSSRCWWFDSDGFIYKRSFGAEGNLITVVDDYSQTGLGTASRILPPELLPNMFSILKALASSGLSIKETRLNDLSLQEIEVDTYDGPKIYFSLRFPSDNDLAVVKSLKTQPGFGKLQYIDFRVANRAYYK